MFSKTILLVVFITQLVGVPHLLIEETDFTVKSIDPKGPSDLHWNCFKAINIWGMSERRDGRVHRNDGLFSGRVHNDLLELICHTVQELCESQGGRPGLSVLTSLLVSVDVKLY